MHTHQSSRLKRGLNRRKATRSLFLKHMSQLLVLLSLRPFFYEKLSVTPSQNIYPLLFNFPNMSDIFLSWRSMCAHSSPSSARCNNTNTNIKEDRFSNLTELIDSKAIYRTFKDAAFWFSNETRQADTSLVRFRRSLVNYWGSKVNSKTECAIYAISSTMNLMVPWASLSSMRANTCGFPFNGICIHFKLLLSSCLALSWSLRQA